ncbi:RabGAP/TBC [Conidiobolus coronatus NRRL 28638]|uniref:RabGAP/TBC n=1 Tax=Conidiobolus coronatus (strain ATCC 28846 / CBS 209.66 / NRRL 28638) TaxID=796925 RepID=A0A137PIP6_CONC2|nr:RabGAP/TBC [Conidiobolus coronatus NRRL 28638]|eukprot:KXN74867.1 RabGAP/TBC [Conidiobolus coronatus NRRL 28638]
MESRLNKFEKLLKEENVAIDTLRKLSWKGIPTKYRAESWKLLLGYASSNSGRRQESLLRKRNEYFNVSKQLFDNGEDSLDKTIFQQISIDLPRTFPTTTLFHQPGIRKIMERVLYTWSIRHPASGYVQGINDIVCPFIVVFLTPYLPENQDPEAFDVSSLSEEVLNIIEADTFWCFSKLMDGIQDNYTFAQRGIQRQLTNLKALIERADNELAVHLMNENVEFIQFAFRWMNCLLLREVNLNCSIRMWDTYLSEGFDNFSDFHLYVCAAFLQKFKSDLLTKDFQDILLYLQSPPTKSWTNSDIELLLSEAYLLQSLFKNAPNLFS